MSTRTSEATAHDFEVPAWESIIPFNEIATPEISADFLPAWAGAFVREISACAQTPEGFGVMLGYSTIAACVQRRFCVSPYADSYSEPVNVWTNGVMSSGSRKTFVHEQLTDAIQFFPPTSRPFVAFNKRLEKIEHSKLRRGGEPKLGLPSAPYLRRRGRARCPHRAAFTQGNVSIRPRLLFGR